MKRLPLLLLLVVLLSGCNGANVSTRPSASWSRDARFSLTGVSQGWAVGKNGLLVHHTTSWGPVASGVTEDLNGVASLDGSHVWAVGDNGTILFYNGQSWTAQESHTSVELTGVYPLDEKEVWAVGWDTVVLRFDGTRWSVPEVPVTGSIPGLGGKHKGAQPVLRGVFATDPSHVWAVGSGGLVLFYNGTKWEKQPTGTDMELMGVSGFDTSHVWATGLDGTVLFYDGKSWRREKTLKGYVLRGVCAEKAGVDIVGYLPVGNASIVRTGYGLSGPRSILLRRSAGRWQERFLDDREYPTGVSGKTVVGLGGIMTEVP